MKKSYYIGVAILALLITTAVISVATFAFSNKSGHYWGGGKFQQKSQFIVDTTYEEWETKMQAKVQAMRDKADELETNITEENFETLQQIYQLIEDGNFEEAKALKANLGLFGSDSNYEGKKAGFRKGGHWNK